MEETIRVKLRQYLARFFAGHPLCDDDDIFRLGFVTSMFAMQLVQFVELEFALTLEDAELEIDNFRTIDALTALVARKIAR